MAAAEDWERRLMLAAGGVPPEESSFAAPEDIDPLERRIMEAAGMFPPASRMAPPVSAPAPALAAAPVLDPEEQLHQEQLQEQLELRHQAGEAWRSIQQGRLTGTIRRIYGAGLEAQEDVGTALGGIYRDVAGTPLADRIPGEMADIEPTPEKESSILDIPAAVLKSFPGIWSAYDWAQHMKSLVTGEKEISPLNIAQAATQPVLPALWQNINAFRGKSEEELLSPDAQPERTTLTMFGQVASTASRPLTAFVRALAENKLVEDKGELDPKTGVLTWTDPKTGETLQRKTGAEIFDEVIDAARPLPATRRADASYVDVARRISQMAGGTGDEWYVYAPGIAADIAFDPSTYITKGGYSVVKAGKQIQKIAYRAMKDAGEHDALGMAAGVGQWIMKGLSEQPRETILEDTARIMGEKFGEDVAQQVRQVGRSFGEEGWKFAGREIPGLEGERLGAVRSAIPAIAAEQLRRGGRWIDSFIARKGETAMGKEQGWGTDTVERLLDNSLKLQAFFSTAPPPGASAGYRAVQAERSLRDDIANEALTRAEKEYKTIARVSKLGIPEKREAQQVLDRPFALEYGRRKAGEMYQDAEMDTVASGLIQLTHDQHFQLSRGFSLAYARAIYNGQNAGDAAQFLADALPKTFYRVLPKEQADIVAPALMGSPMFSRLATNVGQDWQANQQAWSGLASNLRKLTVWVSRQFEDMLRAEEELGLDVEGIDSYVPHILRNKKALTRETGLVRPPPGMSGEDFMKHRTVGSIMELEELGTRPVQDIFQLLAARRVAHEHAMRLHGFQNSVAERWGRVIEGAASREEARIATIAESKRTGQALGYFKAGKGWHMADREVADAIDRVADVWAPKNIPLAWKWYDLATAWWKGRATAARLGFHMRNLFSDMWNMALGGLNPVDGIRMSGGAFDVGLVGYAVEDVMPLAKTFRPKGYKETFADRLTDKGHGWLVEKGKKAAAREFYSPTSRRIFTGQELYELARKHGVIERGWVAADIDADLQREVGRASHFGVARSLLSTINQANPFSANYIMLRVGGRVGRARENFGRLTFWMDRVLNKGESPEDASAWTKKILFDYKDLSPADRAAKRAVPFWTWMRKNVPLQLWGLYHRPGQMTLPMKLQRASDRRADYEEEERQVRLRMLAAYRKRMFPFSVRGRLNLPGVPDTGNAYIYAPDMPYRDLQVLDTSGVGQGLLAYMTPLVKVPLIDLRMGKRFDTQEEFGDEEIPAGLEYLVRAIPKAAGGGVRDAGYDQDGNKREILNASGQPVKFMSGRLAYVLSTMFPDVATWGRLLGAAGSESQTLKEKQILKIWADTLGLPRFFPVEPARVEAEYMQGKQRELERILPRGLTVEEQEEEE